MRKEKEKKLINFIKDKIKKAEYISFNDLADLFDLNRNTIREILKRNGIYKQYVALKMDIVENNTPHVDIEYYKKQVNIWKNKYNKLKKEVGLENEIINLFKKTIERYDNNVITINQDFINENKIENEEPILILSDIHYGAEVDNEETMMLNIYNTEIAKKRIRKIYNKFLYNIERLRNDRFYDTVNLWLLGDMVEGIIHDEIISDTPVVDQIIELGLFLSELIYDLSTKFKNVYVVGIIGNHGRIKEKVYNKHKYNNFDYLVYKFMEIKCENLKNVNFIIPKSPMCIIQKFNYNFLLRHGDGKSYSYAGIPVYGIIRQSSKLQQIISADKNIYIHYEILGHYHSNISLPKPSGDIIVCGSLKGIDEYAFNNFLYNDVSQTMLIINESDGIFAKINLKP